MVLHRYQSYHPLRPKKVAGSGVQLRMAPMIDVVFLLLIFFLLTANFRSQEGFLPADLPQQVTRAAQMEQMPLELWLESQADGSCEIQIGLDERFVITDFDGIFGERLKKVLATQGRSMHDPIKFMPSGATRWDHVVKAYDVLWQLGLEQIVFVLAK
jgi:biopolymer transport protein ExbD